MACDQPVLPLLIFLTIACVILSYVISNAKWHIYLKKRQKSYDALCQDRNLHERMIRDYIGATRYWGKIAPGEKYLFLQGHLPIEYCDILSAYYRCKE